MSIVKKTRQEITVRCANTAVDIRDELTSVPEQARLVGFEVFTVAERSGQPISEMATLSFELDVS